MSVGEINRELTVLRRMFSLGVEAGKLHHKPHIAMLAGRQRPRRLFRARTIRGGSGALAGGNAAGGAYVTGWRINSDVLPLQWRQVDLRVGEVRLDPGTTKNREGRVFYLTPELQQLLKQQQVSADDIQSAEEHDRAVRVLPSLGHQGRNARYLSGQRISAGGFYQAWRRARTAAGCPRSIPHDFRRTAIRNMVRAGIPERVAMNLTGHKTRSVFERYNVVSDGDLRDAARPTWAHWWVH